MRDHRHPREFRPPWWPKDEPFPPARGDWRAMRGHFFRRIALMFVAFFAFVFLVGGLGAVVFGGWAGREHGRAFPGFWLVILALVVGFALFGRAVRRTARPIGDVMDAAARVADGDYSARATVQGPPDVRELARAFNEMAARIETTEEQRRNLLADVSHELRTPLAVIRGRVEGMLDGLYRTDGEHLRAVIEQTQVMGRLLDDLQLLSRAEAGVLELHRERLSPAELVDAAVAAYRAQAEAGGIGFRGEAEADLPAIDADRVRIGEVLSNLVTNALRHTPAGGSVTVRAAREGDGVALEVSDTGAGMSPEQVRHMFDRFTKSEESGGAGLGLAIAKGLVTAHGGTISAASEPGRGTSVRFVLPA